MIINNVLSFYDTKQRNDKVFLLKSIHLVRFYIYLILSE